MARISEIFQVDLPLISVFENPTIDGLAKIITGLQSGEKNVDDKIKALDRNQVDEAELERELDSLSDSELEALLSDN